MHLQSWLLRQGVSQSVLVPAVGELALAAAEVVPVSVRSPEPGWGTSGPTNPRPSRQTTPSW